MVEIPVKLDIYCLCGEPHENPICRCCGEKIEWYYMDRESDICGDCCIAGLEHQFELKQEREWERKQAECLSAGVDRVIKIMGDE